MKDADTLAQRLNFIRPVIVRSNLLITLRHVIVLVRSAELAKLRAKNAYYKSILLLAGSMLEALTHLLLKKGMRDGHSLPYGDWEYKEPRVIRKINGNKEIIWCLRKKCRQKLTNTTTFKNVNKICKDLGLLDAQLFIDCEKAREMRNQVHLMGLSTVVRTYKKEDAEFILSAVVRVLDILESKSRSGE
jgi:hypothetical protein